MARGHTRAVVIGQTVAAEVCSHRLELIERHPLVGRAVGYEQRHARQTGCMLVDGDIVVPPARECRTTGRTNRTEDLFVNPELPAGGREAIQSVGALDRTDKAHPSRILLGDNEGTSPSRRIADQRCQ